MSDTAYNDAAASAAAPSRVEDVLHSLLGSTMSRGEGATDTLEAARYHLASGGKRVRAQLGQHAARALGVSAADGARIGAVAELIHNASLVYDDLQDRDRLRRGADAVWVRFGPDVALCTGALLLSAAYGALAGLSQPERVAQLVALTHRRTAHLIHGQTADLSSSAGEMTTADYEQIATDKSGVLFALPLELACVYAGEPELSDRARRAANQFAVGYQIADDLDDLSVDSAAERLNYVSLLRRVHDERTAVAFAKRRSLALLDEAGELARSLPRGAGELLASLSAALAAKV
jgi:geranylgeranyl pyrophosphate synthase